MTHDGAPSSLALLKKQRSHMLFVLSGAEPGFEREFLQWYGGDYQRAASHHADVLSVRHYAQHEVDITRGQFPCLPFKYLGIYEISVDGASAAGALIETVTQLHARERVAQMPATWLYYPANEKVGRSPAALSSLLTVAFANGIAGRENEFREWYATRHLRHALNIPALVSGQCFERTQFQACGAMEASFNTIAVYEQEGTPQDIVKSFASLPHSTFDFPALDVSRFSESVYQPI